ncbi:MAG: hypothetical protein ACRERD_34805 [Candidatus Binatia bacterium]
MFAAVLAKSPSNAPDAPVFYHNNRLLSCNQFSHHVAEVIFPKLGIEDLWIHDLRGLFITDKLDKKWDRKFIKMIAGHRTDHAFNRYVRPSMEQLRQVVDEPAGWHHNGGINVAQYLTALPEEDIYLDNSNT